MSLLSQSRQPPLSIEKEDKADPELPLPTIKPAFFHSNK
jgi:hypothetical protein